MSDNESSSIEGLGNIYSSSSYSPTSGDDASASDHKSAALNKTAGVVYESLIKNLRVSKELQGKFSELCKRVEKTFMLTKTQNKKVRAFDCSSIMHSKSSITQADEHESSFNSPVFTAEEIRTIKKNYSSFCKKFHFSPEKDVIVFLPNTFRKYGVYHMSVKQMNAFHNYISRNINRSPKIVYDKFVDLYGCYRKGSYTAEEDELIRSWVELDLGNYMYAILGRILHRRRSQVRRRALRLQGIRPPSELNRFKFPHIEEIKMLDRDTYPDWTMDEEAWREISEANGKFTVKELKKTYFRDLYPSVRASTLVSSNTFKYTLIKKMSCLKNPTWDNVNWKKLGQECFTVGAVRVYSAVRALTKKYVPREQWTDLEAALNIIKEKHYLFNGPKKFTPRLWPRRKLQKPDGDDDNDPGPSPFDASLKQDKVNLEQEGQKVNSCLRSVANRVSHCRSASSNVNDKLGEQIALKRRKRIKESCWRSVMGSDSDSSHTCSTSIANSVGSRQNGDKQREDELEVGEYTVIYNDSEGAVVHQNENEKHVNLNMEMEELNSVPSDDDGNIHTLPVTSNEIKEAFKESLDNKSPCGAKADAPKAKTDFGDPLSTVENPNFNECLFSISNSESLDPGTSELPKSDTDIYPCKMLEKSPDKLVDNNIANSSVDFPNKRKEVSRESIKSLNSCSETPKDLNVDNLDDNAVRTNVDSGKPLSSTVGNPNFVTNILDISVTEYIESKMKNQKLEFGEFDNEVTPKKGEKFRKQSTTLMFDSCYSKDADQSVDNSEGNAPNTDCENPLSIVGFPKVDEVSDSEIYPEKELVDNHETTKRELVESDQLVKEDQAKRRSDCIKFTKDESFNILTLRGGKKVKKH